MRFSGLRVLREGLTGNRGWAPHWRSPAPKPEYDVVIIGGGGHGLATAFYLAQEHGITNVAVLEKGWIGGGNVGRNTTIVRANYNMPGNSEFYSHSLKLWEGLEQSLNFNVMMSQRGVLNLFHSDGQRDYAARRGNSMVNRGDDAQLLDREGVRRLAPFLDFDNARFPIYGGLFHPRGGTARHDAVAWGYARGADQRGVDIIQNCAVTGITRSGGKVTGVETTRGKIRAKKIAVVAAGNTSVVMNMAGVRMPLESVALQAMVSEPVKPLLDVVVMAGAVHGYVSQSDKGELVIGGGADAANNYSQRGSIPPLEHTASALLELFPCFSRMRMLRQWGGIVDMSADRSPIIGETEVKGLYVNCGWGTGGFKTIPGSGFVFADSIANGRPHPIAEPFGINRFIEGRMVDESTAAAVAH